MSEFRFLRDVFKYFAKFPALEGATRLFNRSSSSYFSSYAAFKAEIEALDPNALIPGISDYIFGVDEELVSKLINKVTGTYLFVDYGSITTDRNELKVQTNQFLLGVTVATPRNPDSIDHIESVLQAEQNLEYISQIQAQMKSDQRDEAFLEHITFPVEITPFFSRELHNSVGWTMLFQRNLVGEM